MERTTARTELRRARALRMTSLSFCLIMFATGITLLPDALFNVSAARNSVGGGPSKIGGFSRKAAAGAPAPAKTTAASQPGQKSASVRDYDDDPDIPPFLRGSIDKDNYLRLRGQQIAVLRGYEPDKPFDPTARLRALQMMDAQSARNSALTSFTAWTPIGPAPIPNGQTSPTSTVSGRVTAIDVHPTNPNIAYVGTAQGGLYRTTDGGTTWTPLMDSAQSLAIGAVAINPSSPSTVFVGTGEGNLSLDSFFGVGLYRITNADTTATLEGPFEFRTNGGGNHAFIGTSITKIVVDPADGNNIFVGNTLGGSGLSDDGICCGGTTPPSAFIGLYLSQNALAATPTFVRVNPASLPGGGAAAVTDIAMEPGNANNLVVAQEDFGAGALNSGVFRSTNALLGTTSTWTKTLELAGSQRNIKFAINKVAATVTVLAGTEESSGTLRKSTDGGQTWSAGLAAAAGFCGGQCFYDIVVGLDPTNASIVYLGGNVEGMGVPPVPRLFAKSTDGGTTFTNTSAGLHADQHAFAIAPSNTSIIYDGNDGGIWKSTNAGGSWTSLNNTTLNATQFESIATHPIDRFFTIGGSQDNGTEFQKPDNTWTRADFGDGGFALIDQNAANNTAVTMYHTYFNLPGSIIGFARVTSTTCATDGQWVFRGFGSTDISTGCEGVAKGAANGIAGTDSVLFYAPMALGPGNPNTLYFGTDRLYRSVNKGDTMALASQAPITGAPISAIGISRQNDNVRIVGLADGGLFFTTTGSAVLTNLDPGGAIPNKYVGRAVIDPANQNTAYIALNGFTGGVTAAQSHVWKATNLSTVPVLTAINGAGGVNVLPDIPVNALAVDTSDPTLPGVSVLYAGTDIGVYRSTDGGSNWTPFGTGLPRSAVFDMAIQPSFRILRVATHGRGMWEIALPGSPTAVKLNSFTATQSDDGRVLIRWSTGAEVDNLGFNVYREQDGRRVRITPQLVAGSALLAGPGTKLASGNSYVWSDAPPPGKPAKYLLEDIDLKSKSSWNGPIALGDAASNSAPASAQKQPTLLTRLGLRQAQLTYGIGSAAVERAANVPQPGSQPTAPFALANGPAIKLTVNREGWYRVTQPELIAAGLDSKVNPRFLQLHVDGREIPIDVSGEQDGKFDPADSVGFYGVGLDSSSSDARVYWLVAGAQPGQRIEKSHAKGLPVTSTGFAYTVERKDRTIYFAGLRNGDSENFFGPVIAREPVDQALTLQRVDKASSSNAQIEVALQGVTQQQHQVRVLLNGADIGSAIFGGQSRGVANLTVPQSKIIDGENVVRLIAQAGETDVSLVDSVRITYQHSYAAESDSLRLTAAGGQLVTIDGFSGVDVRVFDVTNADAVQELAPTVKPRNGGYAVTAAAAGGGTRTLLALTSAQAKQVASARANQPSNLRRPSNAADLLIITHRDFAASVASLKLLRQSQGLSVAVVDVEDVYDEFSYGAKTPQAVKDFLAYAKGYWKKAPRYALFVGDASLDPKNYLGYGDSDYVPTKLLDTEFMETASDAWLADFDNDGVEDLALGRLPVRTPQEAAAMIDKIVSFDRARGSDSVLLVADRDDGYSFESTNALLRSLIPAGLKVVEIDRGGLDDATAKSQLLQAINQGQKIVNYTGHGSLNSWRGQLLTNDDASRLTNGDSLSLFITMTCLNGYYQDPALDALAESLMKATPGGAAAVWASSGMTAPGNQLELNQQLYRLVFGASVRLTLGEATMRAKAVVNDQDVRRTWILFGDPSMKLK